MPHDPSPSGPIPAGPSRRAFLGGAAAATAALGLSPGEAAASKPRVAGLVSVSDEAEYDRLVKLCYNENPYGPSESVLRALEHATRYANRYLCPDGGVLQAIAAHHGVAPENVLLGAGSTEVLGIAARAFLAEGQQIIGSTPTFELVYQFATGVQAAAHRLPLLGDYRQDVKAIAAAARRPDAGFVYVCNPNNPTGLIVTRDEVAELVDAATSDTPLVIDEAYCDFADSDAYRSALPYVRSGEPVVVVRTFSKAYGMAGVRLGYAVAPPELIERMSRHAGDMSVSVLARWAGAAAIADQQARQRVCEETIRLRREVTVELRGLGYESLDSQASFFMVDLKRPVKPVIDAFRTEGVLVGRPFPPMLNHLRVSIGAPAEMQRFLDAFKKILPAA